METKTVLITGASSGFGEATAKLLSESGYKLILIARRKDKLEKLKKELKTEVHIQQTDVTKRGEVEKLFNNLPANFKNIDVLINNAGLAAGLDLAQNSDLDDWEKMIDTNNKGLVYCTNFALKTMKVRNAGLIINIGSVSGSAPYPKGNVYGATKAFVRQFSRNLRADLAGTDIKVSNIEPGAAETEFSIVRFKGDSEKAKQVYEKTRALQAIDIANTIKWIIEQPMRVNIDNIEIMPIDQTYAGLVTSRR
ncbi:SDR family NAD(P)-dependent oxidoreductase [Candidatus Dojkabacteria bacterium]|uniref:SDR family NAD(P)-dependent oxidoreductase n=1 Tax=Candidatus Dojkabacteria bacterium TaxID=2099670 RepID=A0A955L086_9BACT|nr:SDR family NAD(P)-dependent oxidoreductase [Candidatus Dojkabacteria bacterium]